MRGASSAEEPVSGACALSDLPLHLVYKITRNLDLRSQRNLFLCSSQLHSKWQLHIPDDVQWQFVQACVNMLEKASADGLCDASSVNLGFYGASAVWGIVCQAQQQSRQFHLGQISSENSGTTDWSSMTKDQLWHRLTGAPELASAELSCASHPELLPRSDGLKAFAQQTFDLLCTAKGSLLISMKGLDDSSEEEGLHTLNIIHVTEITLDWMTDHEQCIVDPPKFVFDDMSEQVTAVRAHFYSYNSNMHQLTDVHRFASFHPESQVIRNFAYKGNVDNAAWAGMQYEAFNDWYEDMNDVNSDDDLGDGNMANLLGAMQG